MRAAFRYSLTDRTGFVISVCFLTQGLSSETGFGSGLQFVRATLCDVELSGRPIVLGFLVSAVGSTSLSVSLLTDTAEPNTSFSELSSGMHDFSAVSFDFSCDRSLLSIFFRSYFSRTSVVAVHHVIRQLLFTHKRPMTNIGKQRLTQYMLHISGNEIH